MRHNSKKKAVCCIVLSGRKVLGVSRKTDSEDFGLPGGKVEAGESIEEAALRELKEETGLTGSIVCHVYTDYDDHEWLVTSFLVDTTGKPSSKESGVVKWCNPYELVEGTSFSWYNRQALSRVGLHILDSASKAQFESSKYIFWAMLIAAWIVIIISIVVGTSP